VEVGIEATTAEVEAEAGAETSIAGHHEGVHGLRRMLHHYV
jgi:hypothetical protein